MTSASFWVDVTVPIHADMVVFEGDPPVEVRVALSRDRGDAANVSRLTLGSHTGTHVDAPLHFISGGAPVDALPLDVLIGPARVVACPTGPIEPDTVAAANLVGEQRVLFKTSNSGLWAAGRFARDYQSMTLEAAGELMRAGVALVGIDYLSIESFQASGHPVHRRLLGAGIVVLEGLDLSAIAPGRYELVCLPLRIRGGDGAPARVLLRPLPA